jgi:thymidylate kinase
MKKQTIIIFEGHDKSGKSTIAKALSAELDIPIFKVQRNKYWWDPMINLNYLTEGVTQFIEQMGPSVILDRWIGSDYMYSKLFDRDISYRKIWDIDERLSKLNTLVVICYKNKEAYIPDHEDKDFVDETRYTEMTSLINEYSQQSKCRCIHLNTSDENLEAQLNKIIENIW